MLAQWLQHMLAEGLRCLDDLGLLLRFGIIHQWRINQVIPLGVGAEDGLQGGGDRQGQESTERAKQRTEGQHCEEGDRGIDIHGALGNSRRKNQVLNLLVDDDERQHSHGICPTAIAPSEQHRQRTADIGADCGDELGDHTAEERQRQPIGHMQNFQENCGARGIDKRQDGAGKQEG